MGVFYMKDGSGQLKKSIKPFEAMLYVIGFVIGSGIFLKPSIVLSNAGSSAMALSVWIGGGIMAITAALTVGELAAYIPKVGGMHAYLIELYGDTFGFLYGWTESLISCPGSSAALAIAFATFATFFIPMDEWQLKGFAILMIVLLISAQIISTRFGVWLQTLSTIGKLIPIIAIVVYGLASGTVHDISFSSEGITQGKGLGAALLGVIWAYDGWLAVCTLGSEMENSEKNLPRAIVAGVSFVIAVYILFNICIFSVMPASAVVAAKKIGVDVSVILFGNWGTVFITVGMLLSVFGALNAQVAVGTRYFFSMGTRNQVPGSTALASVNQKFATPVNSLLVHGVISILFVLTGTFNSITDLVIFSIWIFYTIGIAGVFILRRKVPRDPKRYHVPLYPFIPIVAIAGGSFMIFSTITNSFSHAMIGIGLTLIGLPVYYYNKKKNHTQTLNV